MALFTVDDEVFAAWLPEEEALLAPPAARRSCWPTQMKLGLDGRQRVAGLNGVGAALSIGNTG